MLGGFARKRGVHGARVEISEAIGCARSFVEASRSRFSSRLQLRNEQLFDDGATAGSVVRAELCELKSRHATDGTRDSRGVGRFGAGAHDRGRVRSERWRAEREPAPNPRPKT
jgi:hypothetical protein